MCLLKALFFFFPFELKILSSAYEQFKRFTDNFKFNPCRLAKISFTFHIYTREHVCKRKEGTTLSNLRWQMETACTVTQAVPLITHSTTATAADTLLYNDKLQNLNSSTILMGYMERQSCVCGKQYPFTWNLYTEPAPQSQELKVTNKYFLSPVRFLFFLTLFPWNKMVGPHKSIWYRNIFNLMFCWPCILVWAL